ncbi:site-specific integrase [Acinetobacter sp. 2JN-4]|uniref:tyrosine-type recombinase/integrase n=1 Tax=Acinetobacter sp. 2JN-4 TaxID=2479844 RepID=UPI000EF9C642|nr:site-specific integrase [Acinetobacter sp. 2JN-4]RLZ06830.1 site-specific integrase [Acinetobacter sp. 2JN-4]
MADSKSTKSMPTGVRIRNGAIQIYFERRKKQYNITLPHPPSAEGITAAAKIRNQLATKAEWGILTDSDIAEARGQFVDDDSVIVNEGILFQEVAQKYLKFCESNADTKKGYLNILEYHWMRYFALEPINSITTEDIKEAIIDRDFQTAKTLNNCLIPLRGVFDSAMENKYISENPLESIRNKKVQVDIPDPFSRKEMNALLDWLKVNLKGDEILYYWYYELAFWSGCRPSELIALKESDFDFFSGMFKVNKSRVRGVEKNVTKTHTARDVYLNTRSEKAANELIKYKIDRNIRSKYLMICPETGEPFFNEKPPRNRLVAAMRGCGIRHRPAYNARHTYATMMLMDGINPVFVSNQMGHSLQMMMKRYAKWMHGDKNKIEMGKLKTD